eukprot:CAMPEP_0202493942 /NCGR_PEP_ID=MMETSP1361-20130828/10075_1 /ASSEMBLY_ACC=CAM_ASM_000849 /TAXON_ID=210615 /ORGANISM="Staurosira complex sp., Strain CCMP2646" /LENGTH=73 /DNA_ID=CAMNT_0049124305 /DNA_START=68 /DNA_END=289 /DNA_ORIENTATION=+
MSPPQTSFWRLAGMSYLQYVNRATTCARLAMKEPARMKAMQQEVFSFTSTPWSNGTPGEKIPIEKLAVPTDSL